jgi:hypothetical protein
MGLVMLAGWGVYYLYPADLVCQESNSWPCLML